MMPKQGEIDYVKNLDPAAVRHAQGKPFSDPACGQHLLNLGVVFSLLPAPPARILDLGVGTGWTSGLLARRGYDVVGVDIAPDMIDLAVGQCDPSLSLRFVASDYERLDFRDEFDAALFYDALHHAEDELEALAGAWRELKPGGICITVEPGAGHAASAQATVARFGVTEKDMPPRAIMALADRIGFRECLVYPRPEVQPVITRDAVRVLSDVTVMEFNPLPRRSLLGYLRNVARALLGRQTRHWLDNSHIVWMRK
jgi:SAM-dependent methyltransferase